VVAEAVKERAAVMTGWTASLMPVREALFGDMRPVLLLLTVAVVLLAAIASVNLATVNIAEMSSRQGELSLRAALGAGRSELIRLVMVEHVMLSMAGGIGGLLLAHVSLPVVLALDTSVAARLGEVIVDWRVQLGAFALATCVGLLSGVVPTMLSTRGDLAHALAQSGRRAEGARRQTRTRAWLVAGETALAAVLLVSSALLIGAFRQTLGVSPGFDPSNVFGAQVRLPDNIYPGIPERAQFVRRLLDEVRVVPGVSAASATFNTFQGGSYNTSVAIEGHPTPDGRPVTVQFRRAAPGYFSLMRIPEVKGRTFADSDDVNGMLVAVVSESFADVILAGEDPIGKRLIRAADPGRPVTIVGVVGDVRDGGLSSEPGPMLYLPYGQNSNGAAAVSLVVKTAGDPAAIQSGVAAALHRVDASLPLSNPTTLTAFLEASVGPARFRSVLLSVLSGCGLLLALVGIVGVTARGVTERTRELGVRLALGSTRARVWAIVVRRALLAVIAGLLVAVPLAWVAARLLSQSIPGVAAVSGWVALPAAGMLLIGGALAAAIPAMKAARLDPIVALRAD
jgi:predicted permease